MTWFDALLLTLLGMLSALGLRTGLGGLVWGGLTLLAAYIANRLGSHLGPWGAPGLALVLGLGAAAAGQLTRQLTSRPYHSLPLWHAVGGLLGGGLLGGAAVAAALLAFPLSPRVDAAGVHYVYPSPELPPGLYQAINRSVLKDKLMPLWDETPGSVWQVLLLPDLPQLKEPRRP
ncbi:hypothetical protein [Deinococcus sp. Marseille-Q6407]|uniref:hypothetical protein n=1 Tax=Deinococcus sp. Marseille-Q6407 TaxID=2969223 RepID=UPI0021C124BA|nr:hypothetical protein [Deinococcus sp. Marseille-Q6407]